MSRSWPKPISSSFAINIALSDLLRSIGIFFCFDNEKIKEFYPDLSIEKDMVRAGDVKDSKNDPKLINELFPSRC